MKNRDLVRILKDKGFTLVRNNNHAIYSNGINTVPVPHHMSHSKGLVRRLLQQAGLKKEEIAKVL